MILATVALIAAVPLLLLQWAHSIAGRTTSGMTIEQRECYGPHRTPRLRLALTNR